MDHLERDLAAAQLRLAQFEKQEVMLRRNVETLREGRDKLAAHLAEADAAYRARQRAARAEKRHGDVETDDGGA